MKKIYALVAGLVLTGAVSAQTDLTNHTAGAFGGIAQQKLPAVSTFSYQTGGYISGNSSLTSGSNTLTAFQIVQLFDEADGVFAGNVNNVSFYAGLKRGTTGAVTVAVQEADSYDYQGTTYYTPGNVIASKDLTLADIDTASTALNFIGAAITSATGAYNVRATFTGAAIPANKSFFVTVTLPQTAGDTLAIAHTFSSQDLPTGATFPANMFDYAYNGTHSGVTLGATAANAEFYSYTEILQPVPHFANMIFANISAAGVGTLELADNVVRVYPNPADDILNVEVEGVEISSVNIYSLEGRLVSSNNVSNVSNTNVNIASLTAGTYIYEIVASNGATFKSKVVKK